MYSPEVQNEIAKLRERVTRGEYSREDCIRAVRMLREGREAAQAAAAKRGGGRKSTPVDVDKLFSDLDSLT